MIENKQVKNKITFYLDKVPENLKDSDKEESIIEEDLEHL